MRACRSCRCVDMMMWMMSRITSNGSGPAGATVKSDSSLSLASHHQPVKVKFISVTLAVYFRHDVLVVVVPIQKQKRKQIDGVIYYCLHDYKDFFL